MCDLVRVLSAAGAEVADEVDTVGGLRKYVPRIVRKPNYADLSEDGCLCQVDVAASAHASGVGYEGWDARTYTLRLPS